jgi:hypothetical protein
VPPETKTCEACGRAYERVRHANGKLESAKSWLARRACGRACGQRLGGLVSHGPTEPPYDHPPCPSCGAPVVRRDNEPRFRWKARLTCGREACYRALMSVSLTRNHGTRQKKAAPKKRARPPAPAVIAIERRVAFTRLPTPAGIQRPWQPVTSSDAPLPVMLPAGPRRIERTPELLTALAVHPDLEAALAGVLTDSWAPFGTAAVARSASPRR